MVCLACPAHDGDDLFDPRRAEAWTSNLPRGTASSGWRTRSVRGFVLQFSGGDPSVGAQAQHRRRGHLTRHEIPRGRHDHARRRLRAGDHAMKMRPKYRRLLPESYDAKRKSYGRPPAASRSPTSSSSSSPTRPRQATTSTRRSAAAADARRSAPPPPASSPSGSPRAATSARQARRAGPRDDLFGDPQSATQVPPSRLTTAEPTICLWPSARSERSRFHGDAALSSVWGPRCPQCRIHAKAQARGGARRRLSEDRRGVRVSGALQPTGGTA